MKRDLTRALMWGRNAAHTKASATAGGGMRGLRVRAALIAALALLGALALATPASAAFTHATSFDGSRTPAGTMAPERMAVDLSTGNVYVIDSANGVVDLFNRYGKYLSQLTSATTANCTLGSFGFDNFEDDVAVDNSGGAHAGNVYIVGENQGNGPSIVTAFDSSGNCLWQVNSPFSPPTRLGGVAVDPLTGDLWIGDRRVGMYRLDPTTGASLGDAPGLGCGGCAQDPGNENPAHLAFDSNGNLYGSSVQGSTQKWDRGLGNPPFSDPASATIDPAGSFDVEVDQTNNDVFVDHGTSIEVYDSTGAVVDPGFASATTELHGIAVDGAANHIYVANNDTNNVEIWGYDPPGLPVDSLTVTVVGTGTVDADHGGISGCTSSGGVCTDGYLDGDTVELTATGSGFSGWSGPDAGACTTATVCDVPMNAAKNITATFGVPSQHNLTVTCAGRGSVAPVACGAVQAENDGSTVILTATPDANNTFTSWSGCDSTSGSRCTVNMTSDRSVTATFTPRPPPPPTLTVSKAGFGTGTVTSSPGGIACGATCSAPFSSGTSVTLTAAADAGSTFAGWSGGGCSGTGNCVVTLGADTTVTATFNVITQDRCDPQHVSLCPCPQNLARCPVPVIKFVKFTSKTLLVTLRCDGVTGKPACTGKLTFKAVIKVRVKHGRKTKLVKKTITAATASYSIAAGSSGSVKLKLTSAAKAALKRGSLVARSTNPKATIHLPKTKVKKKKTH